MTGWEIIGTIWVVKFFYTIVTGDVLPEIVLPTVPPGVLGG